MSDAAFALEPAGLCRQSHTSLEVTDLDRSLAFYRGILGMQLVMERQLEGPAFEAVTGTPGARSRMVRGLVAGHSIVQLFWHSWRTPLAEKRTVLSFEVRDARLAHHALREAGVEPRGEPVAFDDSTAFLIEDPDGHPIEIIEWAPRATPYRAG